MRNAFVLVILSIGAAMGISTSAYSPNISYSSVAPSNKDAGSVNTELHSISEKGRLKELPSNRTNIDENALYEHASAKQNNQSERAFIYINQKYKKPSLHQFFRMGQGGSDLMRRFSMMQAVPQNIMLKHHNDPCKSDPVQVASYFQEYDSPGRLPDIASYFVAPKLNNCNNVNDITSNNVYNTRNTDGASDGVQAPNVYKTVSHHNILNGHRRSSHNSQFYQNHHNHNTHTSHSNPSQNGFNKKSNQREYIELLKSPLLRAPSRSMKPKYDVSPISQTAPLNYKDLLKLHLISKQYNPKTSSIVVDDRKTDVRNNNFPFNSQFVNPTYQNKRRLHRIEEHNFDKDLAKEDDIARQYDKTPDEELLDQYLKDTLEDQVTSKEITVSGTDCRYHECNIPVSKTSSSVIQQKDGKKADCKCGWQVNVKQKDSSAPKGRPERDETKCNQTNSHTKSADITYYEEILTDDSSIKKSSTDLKLLSKLNNTLYH